MPSAENKKAMNYYHLIGKLKDAISRSNTMDEAIQNGIILLSDICHIDYAIAWYEGNDQMLRPYFWRGSIDFTSKSCQKGVGMVGKTFDAQEPSYIQTYHRGDDFQIDSIFDQTDVSSVICVPFSGKAAHVGCMLLARDSGTFSFEEADTSIIFSLLLSMTIDEEERLLEPKVFGDVILSARDITRAFKNGDVVTQVLKGVNLDIYEGEFLAILGESGCGKSTFLNIIGGMDQADSGTFTFHGKDYSKASQAELTEYRRDNIGFIFQSYNLMPNLNAKQNLDLIGELVEDPMDSEEALRLVGLGERMTNYPSQLSGGQQQRISIARALVKKPKLIFADEPTAALDYTTSIEVLTIMEEIVKQNATLVMVTHNEEITRMADRVIRMRDGRLNEITVNRNPVHANELVW